MSRRLSEKGKRSLNGAAMIKSEISSYRLVQTDPPLAYIQSYIEFLLLLRASMKYSEIWILYAACAGGHRILKAIFLSCFNVCMSKQNICRRWETYKKKAAKRERGGRAEVKALLCSLIRVRSIKNIKHFLLLLFLWLLATAGINFFLIFTCMKAVNHEKGRTRVSSRAMWRCRETELTYGARISNRKAVWHQLHRPE